MNSTGVTLVKVETYVPQEFVETLLEALTKAGACRLGHYDHVASVSPVQGFWRPLPGSAPFRGREGSLSREAECKLEFPCAAERLSDVVSALKRAHPYEEPVIYIFPLLSLPETDSM